MADEAIFWGILNHFIARPGLHVMYSIYKYTTVL